MASKVALYSVLALIVLAAIIALYFLVFNTFGASAYAVQVASPIASFPKGTDSFIVNYSQVTLHGTGNAINVSVNGSVDLFGLNGSTKTIAVVRNSSNESFTSVTLTLTTAKIVLDNNTYNVTVGDHNITEAIKGGDSNSSSTAGVLIYLTPSISQTGSSGNFTMTTSAKAIAVSRVDINATGTGHVGATGNLTINETTGLGIKTAVTDQVNSTQP